MKDNINIDDIILSWKVQNGSDLVYQNKTYKIIPTEQRQDLLADLIKTLIQDFGFTRDDFTMVVKNKVIEACHNPNTRDKSKIKGWKQCVSDDFDIVLIGFFLVPIQKADKAEWQIEGKPVEILQKDLERYANPENLDEIRQELTKQTSTKSKASKIQPLDFSKIRKIDDETIRDVPDEDFMKALGVKDE